MFDAIKSNEEAGGFYKLVALILIVVLAGGAMGFSWLFYGTLTGEDPDVVSEE